MNLQTTIKIDPDEFVEKYFNSFTQQAREKGVDVERFTALQNGDFEEINDNLFSALESVSVEFEYECGDKGAFGRFGSLESPSEPPMVSVNEAWFECSGVVFDISDYEFSGEVFDELEEEAEECL